MKQGRVTRKELRHMAAQERAEKRQTKRATRRALSIVALYPDRPRFCSECVRLDRVNMVESTQRMIEHLTAVDLYAVLCIVGRLTEWK